VTTEVGAAPTSALAGSFRDPSGYVFRRDGSLLRALRPDAHALLRELQRSGTLDRLIGDGLIAGTRFVEEPARVSALRAEHPGFEYFLEHDEIRPVTHPYEWSVSMLADAGRLTLDLQLRLLEQGLSLKDATAYNVLFDGPRPVFIDLGSIERPRRLDLWYPLGQFERMFLYPLLLAVHHGWDLRSYFLGRLDGRDVEEVARSVGRLGRWHPRALLDVGLPLLMGRAAARGRGPDRRALDRPGAGLEVQRMTLGRLRGKVAGLAARYRPASTWTDYATDCHYAPEADAAKRAAVQAMLERYRPRQVLDLGCNTGEYSRIAAGLGARVLAADADHDAVELLYRGLRERPAAITPAVVDATNPGPAIGFMNRERPAFLERSEPDAVLALALVHHLMVAGNLSLDAIAGLFHALTRDLLIVEFVPPADPMFRRLLGLREDLFEGLDAAAFRAALARRFDPLEEVTLPGSARTLSAWRRRP
jgi:SAM-dependent methyltransferase